jgi:hypothetical protein
VPEKWFRLIKFPSANNFALDQNLIAPTALKEVINKQLEYVSSFKK